MKNVFAEFIQTKKCVDDWMDSIRIAAQPMLEQNYINENYIQAMIKNIDENGPYVVVIPDVALPHARVEEGSYKTSTSLLKLEKGVMFPQNTEVHLIIVLSASDNDSHMNLLACMVDVFMDDEKMQKLLMCNDSESIKELLS